MKIYVSGKLVDVHLNHLEDDLEVDGWSLQRIGMDGTIVVDGGSGERVVFIAVPLKDSDIHWSGQVGWIKQRQVI